MVLTYGRKHKYTNFDNDFSMFLNTHIQTKYLHMHKKLYRKLMEKISRGDSFSFIEDYDKSFEYIQGKITEVLLFGNLTFNKVSYWVKEAYYCRDLNVNNLKNIHVPCTGMCFQIDKYNNR